MVEGNRKDVWNDSIQYCHYAKVGGKVFRKGTGVK